MGVTQTADKELTDANSHISRASRITTLLQAQFAPTELRLTDDSDRHVGHAGAAPGGETHFSLRMVSAAFAGLSRVGRQRLVLEALGKEFATGLHALALELKTPEESASS